MEGLLGEFLVSKLKEPRLDVYHFFIKMTVLVLLIDKSQTKPQIYRKGQKEENIFKTEWYTFIAMFMIFVSFSLFLSPTQKDSLLLWDWRRVSQKMWLANSLILWVYKTQCHGRMNNHEFTKHSRKKRQSMKNRVNPKSIKSLMVKTLKKF